MAEYKTAQNAEHDSEHHHGEPHIVPLGLYFLVFAVLVIGTVATYFVATIDLDHFFPGANTLVALMIAFIKMSFVVLFFMHVRWSSRLIWVTAISGFLWLAIMFAFVMQDYLTRSLGTF